MDYVVVLIWLRLASSSLARALVGNLVDLISPKNATLDVSHGVVARLPFWVVATHCLPSPRFVRAGFALLFNFSLFSF